MPPIAVHHTPTTDVAWDGPANKTNLKLGGTEAYYRSAFAWQESGLDPTLKGSFRFVHHVVSADGTVGAANMTGCSTGIGVLNGGMGGTTIPDADRQGVWNHLAAHLRDGDREPPELKSYQPGIQRATGAVTPSREERVLSLPQLEVRQVDGQQPVIAGYAAVFNQPSDILADWFLGGFREYVAPGAFTKTLKDGADVRALVNHNPDYVLGRTKSGTLLLTEDPHGLRMEIHPPATRWAEDLMTTMRRGDVDGSSFGFQAVRDRWGTGTTPEGDTIDERWVLEARLFDVSVVTFPAYPQSESQVRSLFVAAGFDVDALTRAILRAQRQLPMAVRDIDVLRAAIEHLRSYLPTESIAAHTAPVPAADHPEEPQSDVAPAPVVSHPTAPLWQRLNKLESLIAR